MKTNKSEPTKENKSSLKRRTFLGGLFSSITLPSILKSKNAQASDYDTGIINQESSANYSTKQLDDEYEAVVIGSGFGGAISACRLSAKWPGKVMTVERGKRYGRGDFGRGLSELSKSFWRLNGDGAPRIYPLWGESRGVFDLRNFDHMDTLVASGYGGGSLIYGNGIIEPTSPYFDETWPANVKKDQLTPYFGIFSEVMNAEKIPRTGEPERELKRFEVYETLAREDNKPHYIVPTAVFFGNDIQNPTPMGQVEVNRYGVEQTSCTYCAECIIGCNYHAKNSTDLNYLHVAENKYDMAVRTENLVDKIVPLDATGTEDRNADGSHGYHVYMTDLAERENVVVKTKRVVLSAGTYGSTEILLKNKQQYKTLTRISNQLGKNYSGNGDFLTLVLGTDSPTDIGRGPTIIQYIDHNMEQNPDRDGFIAEDMSIPLDAFKDMVELLQPNFFVRRHIDQMMEQVDNGKKILLQVHVGLDKSNGELYLNWRNALRMRWPYFDNTGLYNNIINATHRSKQYLKGFLSFAFPTWVWPLRRNVTVHPLGGCILGESSDSGVVSANKGDMGQVFNYQNLYVADGSIIPSSLGANPSLTIGAISEMICEDITGNKPTADL